MLTINKSTNTAVVLHCITVFHPALGSANWQHLVAGLIITFMGNTMQYSHPPLVVTILTNAFDHAKPWKIPEDKTYLEAPPGTFDLVPADYECTVNIAKMIPIPPYLVNFFISHHCTPLIPLCKEFLSAFSTVQPTAQSLCQNT